MKHVVLLIFFTFKTLFAQLQPVQPWISSSFLWGQGSAGLTFSTNKINYVISTAMNIKDSNILYSENAIAIQGKEIWGGLRLRSNEREWEQAPFVAYHKEWMKEVVPFTTHHELEYRSSPYEKKDDYWRTSHTLSLFYSEKIYGFVKPYVSNKLYLDWNDGSFEKDIVYTGIDVYVEKMKLRFYYIPKIWGDEENSWDEDNRWGAFFIFRF